MEIDTPQTNETFSFIFEKISREYANQDRPEVRQAVCIWLLSIVKFTSNEPALKVCFSFFFLLNFI